MSHHTKKLVPPDGGWGWAIAVAFGIYFLLIFSLLASFGLIYKDEFKRLGFTGTQSSFILSTNGGLSMLCGLINGSLLNKFGTRKVSICSGILLIGGLLLTSYSTTFMEFMISYGIITSIGMGMGMSSYSLALNTYFQKRRTQVTGYTMAVYGIGTIFFPQLVSYLLANYSIKDTMLIIAGIFGNTLVAALLLQPVKWHMKVEVISELKEEPNEEDTLFDQHSKETERHLSVCTDIATIHASMSSLNRYHIEQDHHMLNNIPPAKASVPKSILNAIVKTFGLSLLTDLTFLNILIGLSIDFFSEFTFLWIIPFILMEGNLSVEQTATFMSVYAVADISFRFFAPPFASLFKQSSRSMYIISLILLVSVRVLLAFLTNYIALLFVAAGTGAFRGMRLVYWSVVIPEYAPIEKLAAAFGLLFTLNGLWMFIGGPILGLMRDISGNYKSSVIFLNFVTFTTVTMWTIELIYKKIKLRGH